MTDSINDRFKAVVSAAVDGKVYQEIIIRMPHFTYLMQR